MSLIADSIYKCCNKPVIELRVTERLNKFNNIKIACINVLNHR